MGAEGEAEGGRGEAEGREEAGGREEGGGKGGRRGEDRKMRWEEGGGRGNGGGTGGRKGVKGEGEEGQRGAANVTIASRLAVRPSPSLVYHRTRENLGVPN